MVTMKEIAARCGCSVATVSKALNHMRDIGPDTARRIRAMALEMGYAPNAAARTLKTNRSHVIGLLLFLRGESVWNHEFFGSIANGVQNAANAAGYDIAPINAADSALCGRYLEHCRSRGYDGIILMSAGLDNDDLRRLVNSEIPAVTIDYTFNHTAAVLSDNAQGMRDLTAYVLGRGHRRVAVIYGDDTTVTRNRLASFYATCRRFGVEVPDSWVHASLYRDPEDSARITRRLLEQPVLPTCIFYPDDQSCLGGMSAILERGLRIPQDISVVGYDGVRLSQLVRPRITTLKQDSERIGQCAGEMVVRAIEYPREFVPEHITLPGSVWPGETVADLTAENPISLASAQEPWQ